MDTSHMIAIEDILYSRLTDRDGICDMADQARRYLLCHEWCRSVRRGFFERGIAGVLAVFYFEIEPCQADDAVWVIVGDIPPAYIDTESCPSGTEALEAYIYCMHEWVEAVRNGSPVDDLIPVGYADTGLLMPPTPATSELLAKKLEGIETLVIPWFTARKWD